jgi:excinuclease ABC subunit A
MSVAANSDRIIDIGPGAEGQAGRIVAEGPPKDITSAQRSWTAQYLRKALGR